MVETGPNNSQRRWFILVSKASLSFACLGLFKAMGVFIPYFVEDLTASVTSVGTVTSIYGSICSVLAPVASSLTNFGPRKLVLLGGALMGLSTMVAATSTSVIYLAMWLSLASFGQSFVLVCSMKPLLDYFPETFASANGISFAAGSVGMMVLPPTAEWLIEGFGWRGALFLLGAVNLNILVAGALLKPRVAGLFSSPSSKGNYRILKNNSDQDSDDKKRTGLRHQCGKLLSVFERFDPQLLVDKPWFLMFLPVVVLTGAVYSGWHLFLVPHATALGYGGQMSSFLSTFGGVGSLVGRSTSGTLTDNTFIQPTDLFVFASTMCAVSSLIDTLAVSNFAALATLATITGLSIGYTYSLVFVITLDIIADEQRQMAALGWLYLFLGVGQILGGALSGWVYDMTQNYEAVFMMYGGMCLVVVLIMIPFRAFKSCRN